ncbi:MAG: TetR/AcrR family transcriptional regulator [Mycobacterium sp.]|nr:TetR/AcrR family transcriptional regulator [Mycobacterium sp.]
MVASGAGGQRGRPRGATAASAKTRQHIIGAAGDVFSETGYDATTFEAIARHAGLSRTLVLYHFHDLPELYLLAVGGPAWAMIEGAIELALVQSTLPGRLATFVAAVMDAESADRSTAALLAVSVWESGTHTEPWWARCDVLARLRSVVGSFVDDAVRQGELHTTCEVPTLVEMLVVIISGMVFYAGYLGAAYSLGAIANRFELLLTAE